MGKGWFVVGWCLVGASLLISVGLVLAMIFVSGPDAMMGAVAGGALAVGLWNIWELWLGWKR